MFLSLVVFKVCSGKAETGVNPLLFSKDLSCCSHFLTVCTALVVGIQVKKETTSNDTVVSSGSSVSFWTSLSVLKTFHLSSEELLQF